MSAGQVWHCPCGGWQLQMDDDAKLSFATWSGTLNDSISASVASANEAVEDALREHVAECPAARQLVNGWRLIAPADAVPGDGALMPDGTVVVLDDRLFDAFPVDVRRKSWAVRR